MICDAVEPSSSVTRCREYRATSSAPQAVEPLWETEDRRTDDFVYALPIDQTAMLETIVPVVGVGLGLIGLFVSLL